MKLGLLFVHAGCELVFPLRPERDGGPADDAALPDGMTDGPAACSFTMDELVIAANSWTPSADMTVASRANQNVIEFGVAPGKSAVELSATDYTPIGVMPPGTYQSLDEPALAASGDVMVVRMRRQGSLDFDLGLTKREGPVWGPAVPIAILDGAGPVTLGLEDVPSAITSTFPRRMLVTKSAISFRELVEEADGMTWTVSHVYGPASLGLDKLGSGNLTADGLSVVFIGVMNGAPEIFRMDRASVNETFANPVRLYQSETTLRAPYLSNCELVFLGVSDARRAR